MACGDIEKIRPLRVYSIPDLMFNVFFFLVENIFAVCIYIMLCSSQHQYPVYYIIIKVYNSRHNAIKMFQRSRFSLEMYECVTSAIDIYYVNGI